ncbi:peptidase S8/S53 domain-containing protein [Hypoxylon sp. FL0890]|nr:peptidase S8/S53 domain-containing protein [Hypoxylon sp. FL0890]
MLVNQAADEAKALLFSCLLGQTFAGHFDLQSTAGYVCDRMMSFESRPQVQRDYSPYRAARNGNRMFLIGASEDIERPTSPLVSSDNLDQLREATQEAGEVLSQVSDAAFSDAASIASAESSGSGSPLLDLEGDLSAAGSAVSTIGKAGAAAGATVATGICNSIRALPSQRRKYWPWNDNRNTTTREHNGCANFQRFIDYDNLFTNTNTNPCCNTNDPRFYKKRMIYDSINFRALVAELDDCDVEYLQGNQIVSTLSVNAKGEADIFDDSTSAKRDHVPVNVVGERARLGSGPENLERNMTMFEKRTIPNDYRNLWVAGKLGDPDDVDYPYPYHLDWLTAPWAQKGLTGSYLNFEHYLFEKGDSIPGVRAYVLDTGAKLDHDDLAGRIATSYDVTGGTVVKGTLTDEDGHGSCMSSCVGGAFAGTFKQASIVPIKFMTKGSIAPTVVDAISAIEAALDDKEKSEVQAGVLSMSFGFLISDLRVADGQPENTIDPFADLLTRIEQANIVAVASSGNYEDQDLFDRMPRKHGGAGTSMIVVGAADNMSARWEHSIFIDSSGKGILSIYAVGKNVVCAGKSYANNYVRESGSSPATAQVAGIVAMYLAKGLTTVPNAKAYLLQEAERLKGANWPNDGPNAHPGPGPLRAGVSWQIPCEDENAQQATPPTYEEPDKEYFADANSRPITDYDDEDLQPDCVRPIP